MKSKRKIEREIEAYEVANSCQEGYGWATVKHYFEEEIFSKTDEFAKPWYEKPEQTEVEKANKLRKARKLAKAGREKEKDSSVQYSSAKRPRFSPSGNLAIQAIQPSMYSQTLVNPVPSGVMYPPL